MADKTDKSPRNIAGEYYVDMTCIDCDLCRNIAPGLIARDEESGMSFFFQQPRNGEETTLAAEAVESCPTESIGNDG